MSFEAESNSELTGIPVAFPISSAKQNTQTKNFVGHPDRHTWQYCQSLWFSARSVWRISKSLGSVSSFLKAEWKVSDTSLVGLIVIFSKDDLLIRNGVLVDSWSMIIVLRYFFYLIYGHFIHVHCIYKPVICVVLKTDVYNKLYLLFTSIS